MYILRKISLAENKNEEENKPVKEGAATDYEAAYDAIIAIRDELIATIRSRPGAAEDYRTIQALAAAYTLQDYTAERIAEIGETPEGADLYT